MTPMTEARLGAAAAICAGAAAFLLGVMWLDAPAARGQEATDERTGRELFITGCASCHGVDGGGTRYGPNIEDEGAAAADFQLRTGRMPAADSDGQAIPKPPAYSPEAIDKLVAYVASLGFGPEIPEVDVGAGDLSLGRELFVNNCAPCHGANANGGAVGEDALAPSLLGSEPLVVAEAMVSGPGQMPAFRAFDDHERNSVVRFVTFLQDKRDPGGADIGGVGPVPEGFVAWAAGTTAIVIICLFVGHQRRAVGATHAEDH